MNLHNKFKDDGVVVLGVHAWNGRESKGDAQAFTEKHKIAHTVLLGGRTTHQELYKCKYVPRTFFIDRAGRIAATKLGFEPGDEKYMEKIVRDLL